METGKIFLRTLVNAIDHRTRPEAVSSTSEASLDMNTGSSISMDTPDWTSSGLTGCEQWDPIYGCLRRSSQPDTTRTTTPSMDEDPFRSPTPISSHRYPCAQEEIEQAQCLNGGTCYAIEISRKREAICNCPPEWVGTRCEEGYIDPDILGLTEDNMRTASIAAGVSVCILVIFVLLLAIYVYLRYKRKQRLLADHEFEATADELYRRPFSKRSSIVESLSRPGSLRRGGNSPIHEGGDINMNELMSNGRSKPMAKKAPPLAEAEDLEEETDEVVKTNKTSNGLSHKIIGQILFAIT
ncbi:hypothetical protein CAPTEDRAFT_212613 [Capitella teleta]|uniref:EGF-like domain-containing protein n=1 Tax=Capitella teleta TaxID=283909 RepID=R7U8H4_CAPTE|nr:hypothetical protein CAPTEDRAFT_212613 [Capitella teleta]|eukprot:ELT99991.1 hypothetical protein CAPTEDRAFT_212613 [Capitella teleta]